MKEALKLALEAMKYHTAQTRPIHQTNEAIAIVEAALAKPAQREPLIAFRHGCKWCGELNGCEHKQSAQEPWCMKMNGCTTKCADCPDEPAQEPDYAYPTIEEYEEITGFKVNDTFRMGWAMARTTNDLFRQMEKNP